MPGMAERICLTGAALPTAAACSAACTRQMSAALPYHSAPYGETPACACGSDPVGTDGNSSAAAAAPGPAERRASTARADRARPSRRRTARAWSGTGSCWPGRDARPPPARARRHRGPAASISRSVAMLSLAEIICCAAVRTDTWAPGGSSSRPADPTALASSVMVSESFQLHRARLHRVRNRKQHIEFEDRSQRQGQVGVGARNLRRTCRPPVWDHLGDLIRVARARLGQRRRRCPPIS